MISDRMGMSKQKAKSYLKRKGKIAKGEPLSAREKALVKKVMKGGKIYGDPIVELSG